jgi:N-acetylneuraminic acid mutarotase
LSNDKTEKLAWQTKAKGCTERFAHGAVWDPKSETMLVFGGEGRQGNGFIFFNDLWTYSPAKDEWQEVKIKEQEMPSKRAYHACAWDSDQNQLWSFGGAGGDFKGLDDLWSFDPAKQQWTKINPDGPRPKGRLSATLQYHPGKNSLILVGGLNRFGKGNESVRDLWIYDIKANKWSEKKCDAPQLWQCASALDPKRGLLILHGGFDENFRVRTETWVYDVNQDKWQKPIEGKRFTDAHTGIWDGSKDRMIIFGGANPEKGTKGYNEVWAFNPDQRTWTQLETGGKIPGRAYHSAVWEPKTSRLIVFGGTENQFSDPPHENTVWILPMSAK